MRTRLSHMSLARGRLSDGNGGGGIAPWLNWSEHYYVLDPGDADSLYQDTGKTTPVAASGDDFKAGEVYDSENSLFDTISGATAGWKWGDKDSANAINGNPVFYFDGTEGASALRSGAKQLQQYATSSLAFTMHLPFRVRSGATDGKAVTGPVGTGGGSGLGVRYHTDAGGRLEITGFINGFLQQNVPWTDTSPHVLTIRLTSETGDAVIYKDGTLVGTLDSNAWDEAAVVSVLGASFIDVGGWFFHDGLDANWSDKVNDLISHFGIT